MRERWWAPVIFPQAELIEVCNGSKSGPRALVTWARRVGLRVVPCPCA